MSPVWVSVCASNYVGQNNFHKCLFHWEFLGFVGPHKQVWYQIYEWQSSLYISFLSHFSFFPSILPYFSFFSFILSLVFLPWFPFLNSSNSKICRTHRRTGRCGVLAIATWAAWFWAAQGRLFTKKKKERKGQTGHFNIFATAGLRTQSAPGRTPFVTQWFFLSVFIFPFHLFPSSLFIAFLFHSFSPLFQNFSFSHFVSFLFLFKLSPSFICRQRGLTQLMLRFPSAIYHLSNSEPVPIWYLYYESISNKNKNIWNLRMINV